VKAQVTVGSNVANAPNGALEADALYDTTVNGTHALTQVTGNTYTAGQVVTCSHYVKSGGLGNLRASIRFHNTGAFTTKRGCVFNVVAGTVAITDPLTTGKIEHVGNGWYRCSVTATVENSGQPITYGLFLDNGTTTGYAGAGGGTEYLLIWGAQLEIAGAVGSYRKTGVSNLVSGWTQPTLYLPDGDMGDITVSNGGLTLSVDDGVIGTTKLTAGAPTWDGAANTYIGGDAIITKNIIGGVGASGRDKTGCAVVVSVGRCNDFDVASADVRHFHNVLACVLVVADTHSSIVEGTGRRVSAVKDAPQRHCELVG